MKLRSDRELVDPVGEIARLTGMHREPSVFPGAPDVLVCSAACRSEYRTTLGPARLRTVRRWGGP